MFSSRSSSSSSSSSSSNNNNNNNNADDDEREVIFKLTNSTNCPKDVTYSNRSRNKLFHIVAVPSAGFENVDPEQH